MKAVGVVRHLFYTSKMQLIVLELNRLIYNTCILYIYSVKAVGVVRHLLYTSKIKLIVLELNHLIYKHEYFIYTQRKLLVWLDTYSILQKYS